MLIVDPDAHYIEDHRELARYVPDPMRTRLQKAKLGHLLSNSTGDRFMSGRIQRPLIKSLEEAPPGESYGLQRPEDVPAIMKFLGVDISVQLPGKMLQLSTAQQRDVAVSLCEGFAQYMIDQVVDPSEGIYSMIIAPHQDPERAAELIHRFADSPGMCAVCFITQGISPPLGDRHYDPIYRAAEDVELPIVYHANGASVDHFPIRGFQKFLETHTLGFIFYNMATLVSMLVQGVPERFPKLKFSFQEAGIFYIPMLMHRLDAGYKKRRSEAPLLKRLPSEYMMDFFYGTQPMEEPNDIKHLEMMFGMIDAPNTLVYSSDYPHWDFDMPSRITNLPFLDDASKAKILGGNAVDLYRFA
jgi:uncharacterized protein